MRTCERITSRDVFDCGNVHVTVEGPCEELSDEALAVFDGFWMVRSATEPSLHGSGIGRVLMAALVDDLRQRRVECVVLECLTTRAGFYGHLGFRRVDEFDDPSGPGLRFVLMKSAIPTT